MQLQDKRVIITGAASGMGAAGARLFAAEGARVVAVDRDHSRLAELAAGVAAEGGQVHALVADLADAQQAAAMVRDGAQWLGGLDVLWSHAGINGPRDMEPLDMDAVGNTLAINLVASMVACSEAFARMRAAGGGAIVLTSSTAGLVGSIQSPVYSATKSALDGLARSLALRGAPDGIRVNALCPGPVDSPLLRGMEASGPQGASTVAQLRASIPLGRLAQPQELARAALWLASDAASFVTGIALPVDGGLTAR